MVIRSRMNRHHAKPAPGLVGPKLPNGFEIEWRKLGDLSPYKGHARLHTRKQLRKLEVLIRKFGLVRPLLIEADGTIIDGHAIAEALKEMGAEDVAVMVVGNQTPAEIRALRLALNRIPEDAGWNRHKLRVEFKELLSLGFDMELTAFDAMEIDMALDVDLASANTVEEIDAEDLKPQTASVAKVGDVWRCGPHTIVCADATSPMVWTDILPGHRAAVVFTDPPWNVKIRGNVSGLGAVTHREFVMASGEMSRDEFKDFLASFLSALRPVLRDGAILFVCIDWRGARELAEAAERCELEQKNLIVWVKTNAGMGTFYRSQHELVFVLKHEDGDHQNNFQLGQHGRSRSNVWRYAGVNSFGKDRKELLQQHPTVKPVAMIADALRDVSRRGETVCDPFLGSGSTLLAAEETGRVCVGIELDPSYVEVAIRRWQKLTKQDAIDEQTGKTFDELHAEAVSQRAVAHDGTLASSNEQTGKPQDGDQP